MSNMLDTTMTNMFYICVTAEKVMKAISESRIFYHWRLARRGGAFLVGSLIAGAAAGGLAGVTIRPNASHVFGIGPVWSLLGFVGLVIAAALLWWRFSSLQDEMFHRIQNYSYGWGAVLTVAVLIVWGIASSAALAPPINPLAPLLIFAVAKSLFWTRAVRTWL